MRQIESSIDYETEASSITDSDEGCSSKRTTQSRRQAAVRQSYLTGCARQLYRLSNELSQSFEVGTGPSEEAIINLLTGMIMSAKAVHQSCISIPIPSRA